MNAQLKIDTETIKNNIISFSIFKIDSEIKRKNKLIKSEKTLVFSCSKRTLDKFISSELNKVDRSIEKINSKFVMCVDKEKLKEFNLFFDKIIFVIDNSFNNFHKQEQEFVISINDEAKLFKESKTETEIVTERF